MTAVGEISTHNVDEIGILTKPITRLGLVGVANSRDNGPGVESVLL